MSKEYPCVYYDNEKCKLFSEDRVTSYCVLGPCSHETPSNADRIRAMSDDELAEWVSISKFCKEFCGNEGACSPDICKERFRDWLQQPCE